MFALAFLSGVCVGLFLHAFCRTPGRQREANLERELARQRNRADILMRQQAGIEEQLRALAVILKLYGKRAAHGVYWVVLPIEQHLAISEDDEVSVSRQPEWGNVTYTLTVFSEA